MQSNDCYVKRLLWVNRSVDVTRTFWANLINIMASDALAPYLTKPSSAMILTACNVDTLVLTESKFQQVLKLAYLKLGQYHGCWCPGSLCIGRWLTAMVLIMYDKWLQVFHQDYFNLLWFFSVMKWCKYIFMFWANKFSTRVNTLRPGKHGRHFPDDIFKCIFLNENVSISIKISPKFVPRGPIDNIPPLVQIMAWRRPGDKPLS